MFFLLKSINYFKFKRVYFFKSLEESILDLRGKKVKK